MLRFVVTWEWSKYKEENMTSTVLDPVMIRPNIGTRRIGDKLCLINQRRREWWLCGGMSLRIWQRLAKGLTTEDIANEFSEKFKVPVDKVRTDVSRFLEQLWQRQIVDLPNREGTTDAERAAMVTEEPHNTNDKVYAAAMTAEILFRVWIDLLIPCNLRCRHCYLDFSEKDLLPFAEYSDYLDQLTDHGCPDIALTGGEIFLRKDLFDFIEYAEEKGFSYDLYTNGNFITEEKANRLGKYYINTVQISVYGTTAEVHERITREPGTFDKSVRAAKMLIERGIPVRLQHTIQNDNYEDAFGFPDFAMAMGADYSMNTKLIPNRNGSTELLQFGVTLDQQAEIYKAGIQERKTKFICPAGVSKARIGARGDVYPCDLINTAIVGNLREQNLADMWSSQRRKKMRQDILGYKPNRCHGCGVVSDCEPCAAIRGYGEPGHMESPVSEACMLTTASLMAQGRNVEEMPFGDHSNGNCMSTILAQAREYKGLVTLTRAT
jgi:radical SAM protein with 4Fe4S-binding SPASM domain